MANGFFLGGMANSMQQAEELGLKRDALSQNLSLQTRALNIQQQAQDNAMKRDAMTRADALISSSMKDLTDLTQSLIDKGTPPDKIALLQQPLVDSITNSAKAVGYPESSIAAIKARAALMLARTETPSKLAVIGEGILGDKTYGFPNAAKKTATPVSITPNQNDVQTGVKMPPGQNLTGPGTTITGVEVQDIPAGTAPAATVGGTPTPTEGSFPPSQSKIIQKLIDSGYTSQPVLDFKAMRYNLGDITVVNSLGRAKAAAVERKAIQDRGAEIAMYLNQHPEDVNARKAQTAAGGAALTQMTKMKFAIETFENTALRNGEMLVSLAKKVDQTGVPVVERWTRAGRQEIAGDPDVSNFNLQMTLFRAEVAKIMTNPNLTGILTDESRREVAAGLRDGASFQQVQAAYELLKRDFTVRHEEIDKSIENIKKSFGPSSQAQPTQTAPKAVDWRTYFQGK